MRTDQRGRRPNATPRIHPRESRDMNPLGIDAENAHELANDADEGLVVSWPPVSGWQDHDVPCSFAELAKMAE